jgi:hypothetical protein
MCLQYLLRQHHPHPHHYRQWQSHDRHHQSLDWLFLTLLSKHSQPLQTDTQTHLQSRLFHLNNWLCFVFPPARRLLTTPTCNNKEVNRKSSSLLSNSYKR